MDILQEAILQNLPSSSKRNSKCININCPCCIYMGESRNDTRGRGGLFTETSQTGYNCFNCGFKFKQPHDKPLSNRTKKFLELMGVPDHDIKKIVFTYRKNDSNPLNKFNVKTIKKPNKIDLNFEECSLPEGTQFLADVIDDVDENHNAFRAYYYAMERNIENYPYLMWSSSYKDCMNQYLILPFIFEDKIVGYQARYFGNNKWIKDNRRFINKTPNTGKFIYGIENIFKNRKYLLINESPIDSIAYHGVGVMSHNITNKQIDLINHFKGTKILVLDNDISSSKMVDTALNNDWGVYYPFWENINDDLGSMTKKHGKLFIATEIIKNYCKTELSISRHRKRFIKKLENQQ